MRQSGFLPGDGDGQSTFVRAGWRTPRPLSGRQGDYQRLCHHQQFVSVGVRRGPLNISGRQMGGSGRRLGEFFSRAKKNTPLRAPRTTRIRLYVAAFLAPVHVSSDGAERTKTDDPWQQ